MNLLPLEQKKRIKSLLLYQSVISSGLILILLSLIVILFLSGFLVFLNFQYQEMENKIGIEQSKITQVGVIKNVEKNIKDLNKELRELSLINTDKKVLYDSLEKISNELLSEVRVDSLEIDNLNKVSVYGYSDTRAKLLRIKNILETSSGFKEIDFPLSNLTNSSNIDFHFSFTLYLEPFTSI